MRSDILSFDPLLPPALLIFLGGITAFVVLALLLLRRRGATLRSFCLVLFILALANPLLLREERESLKSVVAVVVDRSLSQNFGQRREDTDQALALLQQNLAKNDQFELRLVEVDRPNDEQGRTSSRLFAPLQQALADVAPSRRAGAVLITDGQLHDVPASFEQSGIQAPINALITGEREDYDRRLLFVDAPRFGLIGKPITLSVMVVEEGRSQSADSVLVDFVINGEATQQISASIGQKTEMSLILPLSGSNIIEARIATMPDEVTERNNHQAVVIDGIRENLNVLLISGEPHNGVRLWRDLLKSDTGIDLIHFTILRPPEKFDNTPVHELSLIAFPTTELFVDKIDQFDLVILDRYQHYDVLPLIYYDYLAQYVENGGAVLMVTGPEYAGSASLAQTPLISILPALPTGEVINTPFLPQLTQAGEKHPVTNGLSEHRSQTDLGVKWGRWLRQIAVEGIDDEAQILMEGAGGQPLLLLSRQGQGRVAMLLSDQAWLWARGFEGGGPYVALYRRNVHWLMKQRELEEEALFATVQGQDVTILRQTMGDEPPPVHLTLPSGNSLEITLEPDGAGRYRGVVRSDENGLVRIDNGELSTAALVGHDFAAEFDEVVSTVDKLEELLQSSGGNVLRLRPQAEMTSVVLPEIAIVGDRHHVGAEDKIILRQSHDSRLLDARRVPLYPAILVLLSSLGLLGMMWYRESR